MKVLLFFRHARRLHLFSPAPKHFAFILASFSPTREGVGSGELLIEFSLLLLRLHSLNQPNKNNPALTNYAPARQPARLAPPALYDDDDDAKVYAKKITTPQWAAAHQGMNYAKKNYANDSASLLIVLFAAPVIFN
jgi:hypothetical protein